MVILEKKMFKKLYVPRKIIKKKVNYFDLTLSTGKRENDIYR